MDKTKYYLLPIGAISNLKLKLNLNENAHKYNIVKLWYHEWSTHYLTFLINLSDEEFEEIKADPSIARYFRIEEMISFATDISKKDKQIFKFLISKDHDFIPEQIHDCRVYGSNAIGWNICYLTNDDIMYIKSLNVRINKCGFFMSLLNKVIS